MSYHLKFVRVLMYRHQKALYLTWVENGFIEGCQMAHWIEGKFENLSQKGAKVLGKVAHRNHGQVWKMGTIWVNPQVAPLLLDSQSWSQDFINYSLSNFSTTPWFLHHFLNILVLGTRALTTLLSSNSLLEERKSASSALVLRGKTEISARIHVVRIFLK